MLFIGRNWMYFEDSCRDFTVDRKLDLVVYTGIYVKFEKPYKILTLRYKLCAPATGCE